MQVDITSCVLFLKKITDDVSEDNYVCLLAGCMNIMNASTAGEAEPGGRNVVCTQLTASSP